MKYLRFETKEQKNSLVFISHFTWTREFIAKLKIRVGSITSSSSIPGLSFDFSGPDLSTTSTAL